MIEPEQPPAASDENAESLASVPPTPSDDRLPPAAHIAMGTVALTIAGAGAIVLIGGAMTPTMGATRSTKLEWQQRQQQIEQAAQRANQNDVEPPGR